MHHLKKPHKGETRRTRIDVVYTLPSHAPTFKILFILVVALIAGLLASTTVHAAGTLFTDKSVYTVNESVIITTPDITNIDIIINDVLRSTPQTNVSAFMPGVEGNYSICTFNRTTASTIDCVAIIVQPLPANATSIVSVGIAESAGSGASNTSNASTNASNVASTLTSAAPNASNTTASTAPNTSTTTLPAISTSPAAAQASSSAQAISDLAPSRLIIDDQAIYAGTIMLISINLSANESATVQPNLIDIQDGTDYYRFIGITNSTTIEFMPRHEGSYQLYLVENSTVVSRRSFTAKPLAQRPVPVQSGNTTIQNVTNTTAANTTIPITTNTTSNINQSLNQSFNQSMNQSVNQSLNSSTSNISNNATGTTDNTTLGSNTTVSSSSILVYYTPITIRDSSINSVSAQLAVYNPTTVATTSQYGTSSPRTIAQYATLELSGINGLEGASITMNNLDITGSSVPTLAVTAVNATQVDLNATVHGTVIDSYALDLSTVSFSNGTLTKTAQGSELWKCKDWNFTQQQCYGTWVKVGDIRPGQSYTVLLSPTDPGYAETGVATVNSVKSIYQPGEEASLIMVVLDTKGYLVDNAAVTLTITTPANVSYTLSTNNALVTKREKGIYVANFSDTDLEGNYTLVVTAIAPGVNNTMYSFFTVLQNYDFDIIRNTPVTTDPFKGPFFSSINITPRVPLDGPYNFTEVLPSGLGIVDAPGAVITTNTSTNDIYLTWSGLTGSVVVNYTAQPPLKTPDLLALGKAFVNYVASGVVRVFVEVRNWFLAIDPAISRDDGLVVYANRASNPIKYRNWTTDTLSAQMVSSVDPGQRSDWLKFRCMVDHEQCLFMSSDTGSDINFAWFNISTRNWSTDTTLAGSSSGTRRNFDVECEALTGNCLVVYENSTANNAQFMYRLWNGTALGSETAVSVTGAQNRQFDWINLYPRKGTDSIGIALQNNNANNNNPNAIYAGIWNGTAFGNWHTVTTNAPVDGTARTFYRHYDCAWQGDGVFFCVYSNDSLNALLATKWNGTTWNDLGSIYNGMNTEGSEFFVCGQEADSGFNHTYLGIMMCSSTARLDGGIWNGTAFSKVNATNNPAQNPSGECGSNKATTEYGQNFQCRWQDDGNTAIFVWVNNGQSYLTSGAYNKNTNTFSNPNWTSGSQIVANGAGQLRTALLVPNPASNKMFLTYTDAARDGGCSEWTGVSWDGSGCNAATVYETNGAQTATDWNVFDWFRNPPPQPEITIITPADTSVTKTYYGILSPSSTSIAWDGSTTQQPPSSANAPIAGTELSSSNYVDISTSDDVRYTTTISGAPTGRYAYQSFNFSVTESTVNMKSFTVTYEGYATRTISLTPSQYYIYLYNWSSDTYVLEKTVFASAIDVTSQVTIDSGFTDFVRNRQLYVLVEGSFALGTGSNARADINTDFIRVQVDNIPMLAKTVAVNASAIDDNGVNFCEWQFYNTTGSTVNNLTRMVNTGGSYYYNTSSISSIADGFYNLTVFCNDTLVSRTNASVYIYVDNTPPQIQLSAPANNSNSTTNYAVFAWNVTDIRYETLLCNLTVDGIVRASNVVSADSDNTTKNITSIVDGTHYWNVTCADNAGNVNTSQTWKFDSDTTPPTVTLNTPSSGSFTNKNPLNLNITATDAHAIVNCSIYLDGSLNATLTNITSGVMTNLTIAGLSQGLHTWNATCIDSFNYRGYAATRNFTYDTGLPQVYLNITSGFVFNGTTPVLNYTAIDNIDSNLTCNITVNGVVELANIPSLNNTLVSKSVPLLDGYKQWNVTCTDDAGNVNTSESRIFQVLSGPLVQLQTPSNGTVNNGTNITFKYFAQDGNGIANCSLYINGVFNQSNSSVVNGANNTFTVSNLNEGPYYWNITCFDTTAYPGYSATWKIVSDRSKPAISLSLPTIGQIINATTTTFNFTLTDAYSPNATCNITVDGAVNAANMNFKAYNGTMTSRSQTVINGLHYWNVTCMDLGGNFNTSATWNFTVNVTFPVSVTVVADKVIYQEGEIALVNVTTKNSTNNPIAANMTLDYIYTNNTYTDLPWWNTSWSYRKPIFINQTNNTAITNKAILVNVTVPYGTITSCKELRVVSDSDLSLVNSNVISGDDVTSCYIYFVGSVSAGAVNENNYHVYYGNPAAASTSDTAYLAGNLIVEQLLVDTFSGATLTSNWTAGTNWDISTNNPLTGNHAHVQGSVTNSAILPSSTFNLSTYDMVNLSFVYAINGNWDAGEFLRYDYTNTSGSSWTTIGSLNGATPNVATQTQTVTTTLSSAYLVNGFNIRFVATTSAANEDGGFDNFNLSGIFYVQTSLNSSVGSQQEFILRLTNQTNTSGLFQDSFTTLNRTYGNYSAAAYAYPPNTNLHAGWNYDWFTIIKDTFGPVITLLYPTNQSTLRSGTIMFNYTANDYANAVSNCTLYFNTTRAIPWWDSGFGYRQSFNVSEVSGSALSGFQVNVSVNTAVLVSLGKMRSDCADMRFVDASGVLIPFYLDAGCNSAATRVWLRMNLSAYQNTTIYLYYGNATASSVSNGSMVFEYYDSGNQIPNWSAVNAAGQNATFGSSAPSYYAVSQNGNYLYRNINLTTNRIVDFNVYSNGLGNFYFLANSTGAGQHFRAETRAGNNAGVGIAASWTSWSVPSQTCANIAANTWYNFSLVIGASTTQAYINNAACGGAYTFTNNGPYIGLIGDGLGASYTTWWDNIRVRQYLAQSPTVIGSGTEQNRTEVGAGVVNNAQNNFTANNIANGIHSWSINCTDLSGNVGNSTTRYVIVDLDPPVITQFNPPNGAYSISTVQFNWTATDYAGTNINCSLYLDNTYNQSVVRVSGAIFSTTLLNVPDGSHSWYLNCSDSLGNRNSTGIWSFNINQPDLYLDASRITLNNTNPDENDTITISANVSNLGGVPVTNALVNFYDGNPALGGTLIGNSTATVNPNSSAIFTTRWNITLGYHTIYVAADPYNTVAELNETNNNATITISLLRATINLPLNGTMSSNENLSLNFTLQDFTGGAINYSIYIDNALNGQNGTAQDNVSTQFIVTFPQGWHRVTVQANDALGRKKNSTGVYVFVDYTPPQPVILTQNNSWFNYSTPTINITATDNLDTNINYSLYVDGIKDSGTLGNLSNNSKVLVSLSTLSDGYHQLILEAFDDMNNTANSTPKYIYVDTAPPAITLSSPNTSAVFTTRTVLLNYTVSDNLATTANCTITLDGSIVSSPRVNISANNSYTATNLGEGTHYWNVSCIDQALNANTSETRSFTVYIAPIITLVNPASNAWSNTANNTFLFNASDETGLANCSIIINGVINQTKSHPQVTSNATNNFTVTGMISGIYNWSIECYDNTTYHAYNVTTNWTLKVDLLPPTVNIETADGSWFATTTPGIKFNITDNMDTTLNYTIYADGVANTNGSIANATSTTKNIAALTNGAHTIIIESFDDAGNYLNSTPLTITVDTIKPAISLAYPGNQTNTTADSIDLNFTPMDNLAPYLYCNVTFDNQTVASNMNVTNGTLTNYTATNLTAGNHTWNIACRDLAGNTNTSETWQFTVLRPDIMVNASLIFFNNTNPKENESITVTATVSNIGQSDAGTFTVELRVNGINGTLIGNSTMSLLAGESQNISATYTVPLGNTQFFVLADVPIATNGSVKEINESNNVANATIAVSSWQYVLGYETGQLNMYDGLSSTLFSWNVINTTGGNVYAANSGSTIHWLNLTALSRTTANAYVAADFASVDAALGLTNNSDSINRTYTSNNNPLQTRNYTIFNRAVLNVPVYNSTNNSHFMTGILWDSGDGGTQYNQNQGLVFISTINMNTTGYNGTYDFEMRIPAPLRDYKYNTGMVALYAELT